MRQGGLPGPRSDDAAAGPVPTAASSVRASPNAPARTNENGILMRSFVSSFASSFVSSFAVLPSGAAVFSAHAADRANAERTFPGAWGGQR